ncbi:branched-chain amino acid ABC transporter substrate-binding protein [Paraburkholderia sabiae]|uniref:Branched-chain amino acid ABC transporter substrate-binding protein n=1 Tax=Paraburkholderia sabiae TaxID=273251 RepID=A0ABU9QLA6_9BURK|nr:branched-chain amino acid ABC transporter substrate-binding protein [Paraburkholderia sabiae]WJZ79281.1 branched-chain amino acid ABC transporter substrate-binding protein [Paraburkholderia sabiae]CAD6560796.1 Leucine-, isoleucine-, valine-, threonine-, and alanine-binding protein [Paraburkholderia sabiae]
MRNFSSLLLRGLIATAISSSAPTLAVADTMVKIGFAGPLTGQYASYGKDLQYGVQLALEDARAKGININGQPVSFELIAEDDQGDPRVAVQVGQMLIDKGSNFIVGHFNSGTTIPASALYERAGIPDVNPTSTNPSLNQRGFKNLFSTITNDAQNSGAAAKYAVNVQKAKRIAIIDDRTAFGQNQADEFERIAKAAGGNVVAHEYTSNTAVDFRPQLTTIKGLTPDLIYVSTSNPQAALIAKQMRSLGLRAAYVGGGGVNTTEFINLTGPSSEGDYAWEPGRPLESNAAGKNFAERFKKRFGVDVLAYAQFGYDSTLVALKAMKEANSTSPAAIGAKLQTIQYDGVTGQIGFNADGSRKDAASTLYQVKNGRWVPIHTEAGGS